MMDESILKADEQAQQELAKIDREEWQDEFFDLAIGLMRNAGIGGLLIVSALGLINRLGLLEGLLLSLAAVFLVATGGRRLWRRLGALYKHPGVPTHLHQGARKSETDLGEGDRRSVSV